MYEVTNLGGSLVADNIPIQRIDGVKGNVSITATAYGENKGTDHGPDGVTARAYDPKESVYRNIDGDLRARFCRANLTIGDVGGRVDVENDFGDTVWQTIASWPRRPTTGSSRRAERSRCASATRRRGA